MAKYINSLFKILSFILFLNTATHSNAQQNVIIEDLSGRTDLPEGAINSLAQDDAGFIWLGTWKGLYRYDGYEVINFSTINPHFTALKIDEILIDGNNLWAGSFVTGLFKIDLQTYHITNYTVESDQAHRLNDNNVIALCRMPGGILMVGTERGGFHKIDSLGNVVKSYRIETHPELLLNRQVSNIVQVDDETILLGNNALTFI